MRVAACLLLAAGAVRFRSEVETAANPIRRVVHLLQKMQEEVTAEGKAEEKLYHKFHCYCENGASQITGEMSDNMALVDQLEADIKAKTARKAQLDNEVEQHRKDRSDAKASMEQATEVRKKEKAQYDAQTADFKDNINALNKAVVALNKGMGKAFLQAPGNNAAIKRAMAASSIDELERGSVLSFLGQGSPYGDYQASSGEIVGILKEMKDEMDRDLGGVIEVEEKAVKNYNELMEAKKQEVQAATDAIEKKVVRSGELAVEITEDTNNLENTKKEFGENQEFLRNMKKNCAAKKEEFDARTEERNQELMAIAEAIKILNDDDALDIFKKTLPSPGSVGKVAFIQKQDPRVEAYAYVQSAQAITTDRHTQLGLLSYMLRVGKVDFSKVFAMIDKMIANLATEQKDDDDQLEYCNSSLDRANDQKKEQERKISDLSAAMEELEARMKQLEGEIEGLKKKLAETKQMMADATEQRQEDNALFVKSQSELTAAMQLIHKAKNRLNKFYNPALYKPPPQRELTEEERIAQNMGEVLPTEAPQYIEGTKITVNLQMHKDRPAAPETWEGGYKRKEGKSGGVVALMDMLTKDLEKQYQQGELDEKTAQTDYEQLMAEGKNTVKQDEASLTSNEGALATANSDHQDAKNDRGATNKELEATNNEIAQLHTNCDFLIQNFDFRKAARANEVGALKNAKAVLAGANFS